MVSRSRAQNRQRERESDNEREREKEREVLSQQLRYLKMCLTRRVDENSLVWMHRCTHARTHAQHTNTREKYEAHANRRYRVERRSLLLAAILFSRRIVSRSSLASVRAIE